MLGDDVAPSCASLSFEKTSVVSKEFREAAGAAAAGFVELGRALSAPAGSDVTFGIERSAAGPGVDFPEIPGLPAGLARTYEDHVLGKFYADGSFSRTADALGVERSNLYRKLHAYGITVERP